jgi:hypothetical protein
MYYFEVGTKVADNAKVFTIFIYRTTLSCRLNFFFAGDVLEYGHNYSYTCHTHGHHGKGRTYHGLKEATLLLEDEQLDALGAAATKLGQELINRGIEVRSRDLHSASFFARRRKML